MVIVAVLDYVSNCHSSDDGTKIAELIRKTLRENESVRLSFKGVDSISSSFINTSLISLLDDYSMDFIKSHVSFADSTKYINSVIRDRFQFETRPKTVSENHS